jgi:uncharacterized cupin superfamily protein
MSSKVLFKAAEIGQMSEYDVKHPLNPAAHVFARSLSHASGLQRLGFHLIRIPSGAEANTYHPHHFEEEFFYFLSGRGAMTIDGVVHEVGPGDFAGFTAPSVPHGLRNPGPEDLVYLVGGERREFEVAELISVGKILVRERGKAFLVDPEDYMPMQRLKSKQEKD